MCCKKGVLLIGAIQITVDITGVSRGTGKIISLW